MTANLGSPDRVIRVLIGALLIALPLLNQPDIWTNMTWTYASIAVGIVLIATAIIRFCPLYRVFGLSTCQR